MLSRFALIAVLAAPLFAQETPLYKDPAAPLDKRVADLVSRMTLEEKVSQLMNDAPAVPRLDVPAYNWWNECLHGVARAGRATVFPQAIGMAAMWDTDLMGRIATAISDEARAKNNEFLGRGKRRIYQGLTFWTPNINLFRDPRWGRGMETYGEDPYLTGRLAVAFIKGLQGDDPKYLKVVSTAKHYAVHSGPEPTRHTFDARVSEQDLRESYLPHFEAAIRDGGAYSVMCAYNRVDGSPACASTMLLDQILRKEWGFHGYVVSDCGAIDDIYRTHKVAPDAAHASASAVKAGTDLECGGSFRALVPAVKQNLIPEADVDQAVTRLFTARFRLGMFDPPEMVPYTKIPYSVNDSPEHDALALEAARKAIVLLKNERNLLPLRKDVKTLAVIGPGADDPLILLGNYNGTPSHPVTPLAGIRAKVSPATKVLYARGSDLAENLPTLQTVPPSALFTSDAPGAPAGLKGEYFNSQNFDAQAQPLFTRVDPSVDFHWWDGAPRSDMNDDDFGVRWTGFLRAPVTGAYQLGGIGFNGFEIYVGDQRIARFRGMHEEAYNYNPIELEAGKLYPIRIEFHHNLNDAGMRLVWAVPGGNPEQEALDAARQADAVVLFLGLSPRLEGEEMRVPVEGFRGGDRVLLGLPRVQEQLMQNIVALGRPTVLVLQNGSALTVNWAREHVPAIVEAWYGGQRAGTAIADVLFGDCNPAGRLPVTFYQSVDQLPPFDDYDMKGRTYRYFTGEPLYPFGYGLSYTKFAYRGLAMSRDGTVSVEVRNAGTVAGEEVVQLYVKTPDSPAVRSLVGFERVALKPGESRKVEFHPALKPGSYEISAGGKQPGFRGPADAATTEVITKSLKVD
jgi:beta-glucosidase